MKLLSDYIKKLQEIEKKYGGDLYMVYATDEDGTDIQDVFFDPTAGVFLEGGWIPFDMQVVEKKPQCVCVN